MAKQGPKAVIGNRGYARFLEVAKGSVSVDEAAVKRDTRLDGKSVLTANTDLLPAEAASTYNTRLVRQDGRPWLFLIQITLPAVRVQVEQAAH